MQYRNFDYNLMSCAQLWYELIETEEKYFLEVFLWELLTKPVHQQKSKFLCWMPSYLAYIHLAVQEVTKNDSQFLSKSLSPASTRLN